MSNEGSRPKLVSIALCLPYSGVDSAGAEYLLRHYRVLAKHCEVDAFGIDYDFNMAAFGRESDVDSVRYRVHKVERPKWRQSLVGKIVARALYLAVPVYPDIAAIVAFTTSKLLRDRLREADIVELQWFEYFFFAKLVCDINPGAKVIAVAHDIPSQRFERSLSGWPRPLRRAYVAYVAWLESRILSRLRNVAAHSPKDANLIALRSKSISPFVLNPPMEFDEPNCSEQAAKGIDAKSVEANQSFGFIGALHRPENNDAVLWLLSEIWPYALEHCPTARLYIVGSKPSPELREAAARFGDSVTVTGYVDSVESFYDRFSTAVIPLRAGAGIKLKTVSAVLAGKNIVATPVAVEGTLPDDCFFTVSDSPRILAEAMVKLLDDPGAGLEVVERARREAGSRYSVEAYSRAVCDMYQI